MSSRIDQFNERYGNRNKNNTSEEAENKEEKNKKKKKVVKDFSELESLVGETLEGDKDMAETFDITKTPDYVELKEYISKTNVGIDIANLSEEEYKKISKEMNDAKEAEAKDNEGAETPTGGENEPKSEEGKDKPEEITLEGGKEDPDWVKKLEEHWKPWCEDEKRKYIYERDVEKEGLNFKYYKTQEDKEAGKHAAEVHYTSPNKVSIKTHDGKPADMDFWKSFADKVSKDGQLVNFERVGKEDNKAKLFLACMFAGVETKNVDPKEINFENAFKELSPEEKKAAQEALGLDENGKKLQPQTEEKTTEAGGEGISFEDWKTKIQKAKDENGADSEFNMSAVDVDEKAKAYVAARLLGMKTKNVDPDKLDLAPVFASMTKEDQENPAVRMLALRAMVQNKEKTGFYKNDGSEVDTAVADKNAQRKELKGYRDQSADTSLSQDDRDTAKGQYDAVKQAIIDKARANKGK